MTDMLPPHSPEAEAGLLGSVIEDAAAVLPKVQARLKMHEVFYDIRNALIWQTLLNMHAAAVPTSMPTLRQRLVDSGRLQDVGGDAHLLEISDAAVSSAIWEHWVGIVMEKFLARQLIARCSSAIDQVRHTEGAIDTLIRQSVDDFSRLSEIQQESGDAPSRIKYPAHFGDGVFKLMVGAGDGEPGHELPFGFPWKIRQGELTLAIGEKGKGKTTFLSWIMLNMLRRGMKAFIASMEMRPEVSLKILISQLIGAKHLSPGPDNERRVREALGWLQKRVVIYDFLGAVDYQTLLQAMDHAAMKLDCNFFLIDSLMRLGVADDDYAGQGMCVLRLANHAVERNVHTVLINHLNKSEGSARSRNRGSGQIVDNAFNVVSIERNEKKWERIDDLRADLKRELVTQTEYSEKVGMMASDWDAKMVLHNQRFPGSVQNGSKQLWFCQDSLQYGEAPAPAPINLLERWTRIKPKPTTQP